MRNLNHTKQDAITFFDAVLANKNTIQTDKTYKTRIANIRNRVCLRLKIFDILFKRKELVNQKRVVFSKTETSDLLKLYSYKNKIFQQLKTEITTIENNRILNTCQNCTLNEVNSFDHFLPKEKFPEFVVNPKNLIPSCSNCNGRKNQYWRNNGATVFLNLYLDTLPDIQFLFVDISVKGNLIEPEFTVDNRNGVAPELFAIIESHYNRLKLTERFRKDCSSTVTELENTILTHRGNLDRHTIISTVKETANRNRNNFGYNYWKSILQIALVNNKDFMNRLLT